MSSFCCGAFHLQDIQEAHSGQIVAVFGVDCASGLTSFQGQESQFFSFKIDKGQIYVYSIYTSCVFLV